MLMPISGRPCPVTFGTPLAIAAPHAKSDIVLRPHASAVRIAALLGSSGVGASAVAASVTMPRSRRLGHDAPVMTVASR